VQALYRWQLNAAPWQDLVSEFAADADMPRADRDYFRGLVQEAIEQHAALDLALAPFLSRAAELLDPVEHAVLLIASVELQHRPQVPSGSSSTKPWDSRAASAPPMATSSSMACSIARRAPGARASAEATPSVLRHGER
jgi:NusB family